MYLADIYVGRQHRAYCVLRCGFVHMLKVHGNVHIWNLQG